MDRLIEYVTHHPYLAGAVVLALVVVAVFESRLRATAFAAISSQDLIRLMNQGALVLDIRKPEEFAAGHVNGAKQLASDQILTAGRQLQALQGQAGHRLLRFRIAGLRRGTPAQRPGLHQGIHAARRLRRLACGESPGRQGGVMSQPQVLMYTTGWCPYCERARKLLAAKQVSFEEVDVEAAPEKRAEMQTRSGRSTVPQIFIGDQHVGGSDDLPPSTRRANSTPCWAQPSR